MADVGLDDIGDSSLYRVQSSIAKTQVIRLGNKNLYLLSYLAKSPSESTVLYFIVHSL